MTTQSNDQPRFAIEKSTLLHFLEHGAAALRLNMKITSGNRQAKLAGLAVTPAKDCVRRINLCESLIEAIKRGDDLLIIRNTPDSEQSKQGESAAKIEFAAGDGFQPSQLNLYACAMKE